VIFEALVTRVVMQTFSHDTLPSIVFAANTIIARNALSLCENGGASFSKFRFKFERSHSNYKFVRDRDESGRFRSV
jgi:hypothetical protein